MNVVNQSATLGPNFTWRDRDSSIDVSFKFNSTSRNAILSVDLCLICSQAILRHDCAILGDFTLEHHYISLGCHDSPIPFTSCWRVFLNFSWWGWSSAASGGLAASTTCLNGLVQGKNYRKPPYFMGKSMVSCRFSLRSIHWMSKSTWLQTSFHDLLIFSDWTRLNPLHCQVFKGSGRIFTHESSK